MGFCSNGWISSNNKLRYYLILFNGDFQKYDKSSATDEECNLMTLNEPSYVARIRKEHLEKYPNLDSWNTLLSYLIYVSETICKISMYLSVLSIMMIFLLMQCTAERCIKQIINHYNYNLDCSFTQINTCLP